MQQQIILNHTMTTAFDVFYSIWQTSGIRSMYCCWLRCAKENSKQRGKNTKCFEHLMRTDWQNESENIHSNWNILYERTIYCYDGDEPHFPALHFTFLDINVCSLKTIIQREKQHNWSRLTGWCDGFTNWKHASFFVCVRSPSIRSAAYV